MRLILSLCLFLSLSSEASAFQSTSSVRPATHLFLDSGAENPLSPIALADTAALEQKLTGSAAVEEVVKIPDVGSPAEQVVGVVKEVVSSMPPVPAAPTAAEGKVTFGNLAGYIGSKASIGSFEFKQEKIDYAPSPDAFGKLDETSVLGKLFAAVGATVQVLGSGNINQQQLTEAARVDELGGIYAGTALMAIGAAFGNKKPKTAAPSPESLLKPKKPVKISSPKLQEQVQQLTEATVRVSKELAAVKTQKATSDYEAARLKSELRTIMNRMEVTKSMEQNLAEAMLREQKKYQLELAALQAKLDQAEHKLARVAIEAKEAAEAKIEKQNRMEQAKKKREAKAAERQAVIDAAKQKKMDAATARKQAAEDARAARQAEFDKKKKARQKELDAAKKKRDALMAEKKKAAEEAKAARTAAAAEKKAKREAAIAEKKRIAEEASKERDAAAAEAKAKREAFLAEKKAEREAAAAKKKRKTEEAIATQKAASVSKKEASAAVKKAAPKKETTAAKKTAPKKAAPKKETTTATKKKAASKKESAPKKKVVPKKETIAKKKVASKKETIIAARKKARPKKEGALRKRAAPTKASKKATEPEVVAFYAMDEEAPFYAMDEEAPFFATDELPTTDAPKPATKKAAPKKKKVAGKTAATSSDDWSQLSPSTLQRKTVKDLTSYLDSMGVGTTDSSGKTLKKADLVSAILSR